nr:hypothetical protein [Tanacetum cinerariifolium]
MLRVNTGLTSGENSKLVNSSPPTLGKGTMTNLSTNTLVQEPVFKPDYLNAAKLEAIRYYVIYKGPRAGVYTNWGEVSTICQEDKSTNKKFKSREQADKEFFLHGEKTKETKTPQVFLKPKINSRVQRIKEDQRDQRIDKIEIVPEPIVKYNEFMQLWNKARAACQEDFLHERFYTTDKPTKSLFNFVEGADSSLVYLAFKAGLVDNIYPSNNLLELKEFPRQIQEAIKHFRKKVLKAQDKLIYIKVVSLAKTNKEMQLSKVMTDKPEESLLEVIHKTRVQSLRRIAELILQSLAEGTKNVNYADKHCIITSHKKASNEDDVQLINQFGLSFLMNTLEAK